MPCQGYTTQPLFCCTGAASGSEISASSAEEARREAARDRQNARDLALVFGPAGAKLPPELEEEEVEPAEEGAMARRTPAHANGKAGVKVNALLIVHQLCNSERLLLEPTLWYVDLVHEVTERWRCQRVTRFVPAANFAACDVSGTDCMVVKMADSAVNTVNLTTLNLFASTTSFDYTPRVAAVVSWYSHLRKADFNIAQDISGPHQHCFQILTY